MTALSTRTFELVTTVTFHDLPLAIFESFVHRLAGAVREAVSDYPAVEAFLVEPGQTAGDINYGLRFKAVDPAFADDMANEILEKAVEIIAESDGGDLLEAEREESVLTLAR